MTVYTITNIAGGDARRFRTDSEGYPSSASIRHARRQGRMGFLVHSPGGDAGRIYDEIVQAIDDTEAASR